MTATIQLTSASSNMADFLTNWASGFSTTYGTFWSADEGLVSDPGEIALHPEYEYAQWGNGGSGGNGVVLNGDFQYSQGNLTGTTSTLELGSGYSQDETGGVSLGQTDLTIVTDPAFTTASPDYLDLAVYDLTVNGSLGNLYDYLAATGTVIEDTVASDTLVGFGGADTFVFSGGTDKVTSNGTGTAGYQDGTDTLDVSAWGATSTSDLYWYDDINGDAVIGTALDYSVSITLEGVSSSVLDATDFLFA